MFGEKAADLAFSDVLAKCMEERNRRVASKQGGSGRVAHTAAAAIRRRAQAATKPDTKPGGGGGAAQLVELKTCEEQRARRDVLRLRGEHEEADALSLALDEDLAGRKLPPPPYEKPAGA